MTRLIATIVVAATVLGGCAAKPQATPGAKSPSRAAAATKPASVSKTPAASSARNVDPCAMRLHDLCAPLLLYYAQHQSLPRSVDELSHIPGFDVPPTVCPVTDKPYVYNPHGSSGPDPGSQIILYDAVPHDGRRWGIAVNDPEPGRAPVVKVIVMPESVFTRPPAVP